MYCTRVLWRFFAIYSICTDTPCIVMVHHHCRIMWHDHDHKHEFMFKSGPHILLLRAIFCTLQQHLKLYTYAIAVTSRYGDATSPGSHCPAALRSVNLAHADSRCIHMAWPGNPALHHAVYTPVFHKRAALTASCMHLSFQC